MPRYSGASPSPSGTSSRENPGSSGASTVRSVTFRSAAEILESQDAREAAAKQGQPDSQKWAANVDWSQQERDAREQLARQQRAAALPPPSPGGVRVANGRTPPGLLQRRGGGGLAPESDLSTKCFAHRSCIEVLP